jgi:alpha-1,6-mannosyltransferase
MWNEAARSASQLTKLHLKFTGPTTLSRAMRIVDVCAFYAPQGGGVRTYVDAKFKAAPQLGHEMIVVAPGERAEVIERGPGAVLVTIPSPKLPVDRRYRYFDDQEALHRVLDAWRPDHVEASSPWSSATMVGRWQGGATRSLVMHADPLSAYAYRWLGGIAPISVIDRGFGWYWRHLRGLGRMFDLVVSANGQLSERLAAGGVANTATVRMGVEPGLFSPTLRSPELRADVLAALGLEPDAVLLIGIGRFSAEKRWEMVVRTIGESACRRQVGLLLVGEGSARWKLEMLASRMRNVAIAPRVNDRAELAQLLASADALVHGCEAETFCLVAAEARASGIPLIVPNQGAALDQLVPGAGMTYRAGCEVSLERAISRFLERGPELQRAAAARASHVRSMDEHFVELFARYADMTPALAGEAVRVASSGQLGPATLEGALALSRR